MRRFEFKECSIREIRWGDLSLRVNAFVSALVKAVSFSPLRNSISSAPRSRRLRRIVIPQ
jgi:hypothetical protein